jgi:alpha-glucosidase
MARVRRSARRRPQDWWRGGVLYQIYVRSFADSDGDGIGDLSGVIDRLEYLEWLGVSGVWLSPVTPSPDYDWGYDVSDYRSIHPKLGDLETFDRLVAEAGRRGIKVVTDLVPNHTSDRHPWFLDARSSRRARRRDWYVWADPNPDGGPPNNWLSPFGGPAWAFDEGTEQWYLHNFLAEQPDLNWWNREVREEFEGILRFWLDRGVAGFRIDAAHALVKDHALRDNPPATEEDHPRIRRMGQRPVYNMNRPEVHEIYRRWRQIADGYGRDRMLMGETWVLDLEQLAGFYGRRNDELHLGQNFPFAFSDLAADQLEAVVSSTAAKLPRPSWPAWFGSNHDMSRFPTRWCDGDEARVRCALLVLLSLRGTAFLYNGDEIGMTDVAVPRERLRDSVGIRNWPSDLGRDPCRTPMQWSPGPGAGFTSPGVEPWLPRGDAARRNVADQQADPGSVLNLTRDLIRWRRSTSLRDGTYRTVSCREGLWVWERGDDLTVAANLSSEVAKLQVSDQDVLIGTARKRDGSRLGGMVRLGPWEGLVLADR